MNEKIYHLKAYMLLVVLPGSIRTPLTLCMYLGETTKRSAAESRGLI
jgi:hypothetical protein